MADKAHEQTDRMIEEMEKKLKGIYQKAQNDVSKKVDAYFKKFEKDDAAMKKKLADGIITEAKYKSWRQEQLMTGRHWDSMKKQVSADMLRADKKAADYINGKLPQAYALNYNALADQTSGIKGFSFELVDEATVRNLAMNDKTLLPYKHVDGKKVERWNTKQINSQVMQGIIQGESIPNIAKRLRESIPEMEYKSAVRNARTTVTGAESKGRIDSYHDAQDMGIVLKKVWMSTHDNRVRPEHAELNGVMVDIDEPFRNEIGDIMYPGDPDADPENVYNCRCTIVSKVISFKKAEEKADPEEDLTDVLDSIWEPNGNYEPAGSQKEFMMQNKDELKENGIKNVAGIREQYENTMMQEAVKNARQISEQEAVDIARDGLPEGLRNQWFVDANSDAKQKLSDIIVGDTELLNAGWNIAYRDYMETVGENSGMSFDDFLKTPLKMYRGTHGQVEQANETWISFSMSRSIAESFGSNIEEITIRPIDTWGAYQTTAEAEMLIPKRILQKLRND